VKEEEVIVPLDSSEDKGVWWADDPEAKEPLFTEHFIPNWNRKSEFNSLAIWRISNQTECTTKCCLAMAICIALAIIITAVIIVFVIFRIGQPNQHIPLPAPEPAEQVYYN